MTKSIEEIQLDKLDGIIDSVRTAGMNQFKEQQLNKELSTPVNLKNILIKLNYETGSLNTRQQGFLLESLSHFFEFDEIVEVGGCAELLISVFHKYRVNPSTGLKIRAYELSHLLPRSMLNFDLWLKEETDEEVRSVIDDERWIRNEWNKYT